MTVLRRYLLVQIPGWVLAATVLYALHVWLNLPAWAAIGLFAADVVKDFVLYPVLRRAYETTEAIGADRLIGETGIVRQPVDPHGYIEVRGELWEAEATPGSPAIPEGSRVEVESARGMTLVVRSE